MADGASVPVKTMVKTEDGFLIATWTTSSLGGLATGVAVAMNDADGPWTCQVVGIFGGATAVFEVSNDNTNWITAPAMTQTTGTNDTATGTATYGRVLFGNWRYVRFRTSGGTSTSLTGILVSRRK